MNEHMNVKYVEPMNSNNRNNNDAWKWFGGGALGYLLGANNNGCGNGPLNFGNNNNCNVSQSELALSNQLSESRAKTTALESQVFTDQKLTQTIEYFNNQLNENRKVSYENAAKIAVNEKAFDCLEKRVDRIERTVDRHTDEISAQASINTKIASEVGCIKGQIATIDELWSPKINQRSICEPQPIPVEIVSIMQGLANLAGVKTTTAA